MTICLSDFGKMTAFGIISASNCQIFRFSKHNFHIFPGENMPCVEKRAISREENVNLSKFPKKNEKSNWLNLSTNYWKKLENRIFFVRLQRKLCSCYISNSVEISNRKSIHFVVFTSYATFYLSLFFHQNFDDQQEIGKKANLCYFISFWQSALK